MVKVMQSFGVFMGIQDAHGGSFMSSRDWIVVSVSFVVDVVSFINFNP